MKYQPERDLERAAIESKTVSPKELAKWVLSKRNKVITPEAITNYFRRNPEYKKRIDEKLNGISPNVFQAVDGSLFENGNFKDTSTVKQWLMDMAMRRRRGKGLHPEYLKTQVRILKQYCEIYKKHPDRFNFQDAQEIFMLEEAKGKDTYHIRRVFKDFLKSRGETDYTKIGVGKPRGFGLYKDLVVEREPINNMLTWVGQQNFIAYTADLLMFHNGLRINAVLKAKIEDYRTVGKWGLLTVVEKFREVKTFKLVRKVAESIEMLIGERKSGLIFAGLDKDAIGKINNEAINRFCPEIRQKYANIHPNHFWRHMCAQHLLRATDRNSKAVAALMQCTEQSLNESYGAATDADVEKWENEYLDKI